MKFNYFLLMAFTFLLQFSCNKKENNIYEEVEEELPFFDTLTLKEVRNNDGITVFEFEYNENDFISSYKHFADGEVNKEIDYSYDLDTIFGTESYYFYGESHIYKKAYLLNDTTLKVEWYAPMSTPLNSFELYYFSNSDCGIYLLEYYVGNSELSFYVEYNFIDDNCSYETYKYDADSLLLEKGEYILDNKKNFEESLEFYKFFGIKQNGNAISRKMWDATGAFIFNYPQTIVFQYNNSNYPFKSTITTPQYSSFIRKFFY